MTFQTRVQPDRAQQAAGTAPAAASSEPPHAPLKMPRQTLEAAPGQVRRMLAALQLSRLTAVLRLNLRRAG